jgi:hypothetical protein
MASHQLSRAVSITKSIILKYQSANHLQKRRHKEKAMFTNPVLKQKNKNHTEIYLYFIRIL